MGDNGNKGGGIIRLLRADEIECRAASVSEKGLSLLLYKDARVDQRILDETFGIFGWKRSHQCIDGKLYCTVEAYNTKTSSGTRQVPMTKKVAECFQRVIKSRRKPKTEMMVGGYSGFLFLDKDGRLMVALHWEKYLKHICQKYNSIYKVQMPDVTPHVCRHTFCSNMAKSGMNPKTLQYIMGHSDIGVTLNTYTHLNFEDASRELQRLSGD